MISPIEEAGQIQTSMATVQLRSLSHYSTAKTLQSVKILRVKTPLYYINSEIFYGHVLKEMKLGTAGEVSKKNDKYSESPPRDHRGSTSGNGSLEKVETGEKGNNRGGSFEKGETTRFFKLKVLILDMSEVAFIDNMGVKNIELLIQKSLEADIALMFTNIPESIFAMLQSTGFWKKHADRLFLTVESALSSLAHVVMAEDEGPSVTKL